MPKGNEGEGLGRRKYGRFGRPSPLLIAMRRVSRRPPEEDADELHRKLRLMFQDDFGGFLALLRAEERDYRKPRGRVAGGGGEGGGDRGPGRPVGGGGGAAALELCRAVLEELAAEARAGEDRDG